jgi:Glycosyltransferase family 87
VFGIVSGWHGQFASVAILPAVAALVVWERPGTARRALVAGALIGLGAAVKAVAGLVLLALLPSVRSRSEAVTLAAAAVAVPLVMLAPLAVADPPTRTDGGMAVIATFQGVSGGAGLSLVAQPSLAATFMEGREIQETAVSEALSEHGSLLTMTVLLGVAWLMFVRRTPPPLAATAL